MNLKSNILKIGVVIALIFILIPVIAAEDVDDSAYAESVDESTDVISEDISEADDELTADGDDELAAEDGDGEDQTDELADTEEPEEETAEDGDEADDAEATADGEGSADLQITIINPDKKLQVGDIAKFGVFVYNNGPDKASNVLVRATFLTGKINLLAVMPSQGEFIIYNGTLYWSVGDLDAGEYAFLGIIGQVLTNEDVILMATVTSDTPDPDLSNNIAFSIIDVVSAEEVADELPATGNPIALAMLALLSVAGISLRRRF